MDGIMKRWNLKFLNLVLGTFPRMPEAGLQSRYAQTKIINVMKFKVLNNYKAAMMTSYCGIINICYDDLVECFGQPMGPSGDGKVQAEWILEIEGVVCTIYDWKEDREPEYVVEWHVGGCGSLPIKLVRKLLDLPQ